MLGAQKQRRPRHFTFKSPPLWPHISSLHINSHLIGYFCAQSGATIWLHRRQPVLDGPGHKALKANWLIALSSPFPVPSFWPSASEAQMAAGWSLHQHLQHSELINFTNRDDSLVSSRAQMSDEHHFTSQPTSKDEGRENRNKYRLWTNANHWRYYATT